ncbi:MAG: DUF2294 family protein [Planctomycetia bacterium]|nr:DUF2294 family protein [Planctomycetia bacterium]
MNRALSCRLFLFLSPPVTPPFHGQLCCRGRKPSLVRPSDKCRPQRPHTGVTLQPRLPLKTADISSSRPLGRLLAQAAAEFEQRLFGRPPRCVTVTGTAGALVLCLQQHLREVDHDLVDDRANSQRIRRFHEDMFACLRTPFREHIAAATGIELTVAVLDVDLENGCLLKTFSTGTAIDLYVFGPAAPPFGVPIDGHVSDESAAVRPPHTNRTRRRMAVEPTATARSHEGSQTMKR